MGFYGQNPKKVASVELESHNFVPKIRTILMIDFLDLYWTHVQTGGCPEHTRTKILASTPQV